MEEEELFLKDSWRLNFFLKEAVDVGNSGINYQHKITNRVQDKVLSNT